LRRPVTTPKAAAPAKNAAAGAAGSKLAETSLKRETSLRRTTSAEKSVALGSSPTQLNLPPSASSNTSSPLSGKALEHGLLVRTMSLGGTIHEAGKDGDSKASNSAGAGKPAPPKQKEKWLLSLEKLCETAVIKLKRREIVGSGAVASQVAELLRNVVSRGRFGNVQELLVKNDSEFGE